MILICCVNQKVSPRHINSEPKESEAAVFYADGAPVQRKDRRTWFGAAIGMEEDVFGKAMRDALSKPNAWGALLGQDELVFPRDAELVYLSGMIDAQCAALAEQFVRKDQRQPTGSWCRQNRRREGWPVLRGAIHGVLRAG
jgi:hypothetical protein